MSSTETINPIPAALVKRFEAAKQAARQLSRLTTRDKNVALESITQLLIQREDAILSANSQDLAAGRANNLAEGLIDRLTLNSERIAGIAAAVANVIGLADPVGEVLGGKTLPNGLRIDQVRVPIGVVGAIYEARPNVTIDIVALALKSGNAVILRGGSAAENTNAVLVDLLQDALSATGLPAGAVQTVDDYGRDGARHLMHARGYVDVLIPRGSSSLIQTVVTEAKVPVIETGSGVVHMYLDESAPTDMAVELAHNAKVQRPSVCNALETLIVHRAALDRVLGPVLKRLVSAGVTIHGDEIVQSAVAEGIHVVPVTAADWGLEHLSLDLSVKVVDSIDEALAHIAEYSTKHTEAIITSDFVNAERFLAEVDSAVVMVNASTRFTDGAEFGFGAEVGISTQKLHARGPMGLPQLTSTKWMVRGSGQVRE